MELLLHCCSPCNSCSISYLLTLSKLPSGEEAATAIIASILPGNPTLITCVDDERMDFQASLPLQATEAAAGVCAAMTYLPLQDGQLVTFSEVVGLPGLNDKKPRQIQNVKV